MKKEKIDLPRQSELAFEELYPINEDLLALSVKSVIERYGRNEDQKLKNRIINALTRAGFHTISDLKGLNSDDLSNIRNLGLSSQDVVKNLIIRLSDFSVSTNK